MRLQQVIHDVFVLSMSDCWRWYQAVVYLVVMDLIITLAAGSPSTQLTHVSNSEQW